MSLKMAMLSADCRRTRPAVGAAGTAGAARTALLAGGGSAACGGGSMAASRAAGGGSSMARSTGVEGRVGYAPTPSPRLALKWKLLKTVLEEKDTVPAGLRNSPRTSCWWWTWWWWWWWWWWFCILARVTCNHKWHVVRNTSTSVSL